MRFGTGTRNTSGSWRGTQRSKMLAVRDDLYDWMDKWNAMEPVCRQIYPQPEVRQNGVDWVFPIPAWRRAPEFELPGGWTPPEGGLPEDVEPEDVEVLTPYGAVAPENTKTYAGLTLKTWMFIGGIAAGLIYLEKRWQDQEWT